MLRRSGNQTARSQTIVLRTCLLLFGLLATFIVGCTQCRTWTGCIDGDCDDCRPKTHLDHRAPTMRTLAKSVTHLEEDIQQYGSIVIKQPDIYGETNLMAYIQEYEQIMKERKGKFEDTIQAYIARSDASDLQSITAIGAGQQKTTTTGANASTTTSIPLPFQLAGATLTPSDALTLINPTDATAVTKGTDTGALELLKKISGAALTPAAKSGVAIEPTESLRQNSNYIKVNQGLRRLNTGDDNSQSAGNALYLLRIPVSVLPGRKTYRGYAAKVTMQAKLVIDENHLSDTFPRLVIGELATVLQKELITKWNTEFEETADQPTFVRPRAFASNAAKSSNAAGLIKESSNQLLKCLKPTDLQLLRKQYRSSQDPVHAHVPPQEKELQDFLFNLFSDIHWKCMSEQTYQKLATNLADPNTVQAYLLQLDDKTDNVFGLETANFRILRAFLIQTVLFNRELNKLVERNNHGMNMSFAFYYPQQNPNAIAAWNDLILREFPVHVFNLDPIVEEQNVFDVFSRRREIQLAFAFAVANGKMRGDQALKYSRLMALDQSTIALNRTVIAFAHDHDTFGYIFKPRVQSPPEEKSNIEAIARTIWATGPTRQYDLRNRELEPGMRDCEVLIVMPSFVPKMKLDVTTNWERLEKPGTEKIDYEDMIDLGAKLQEVKKFACNITDQQCFREGDYERLVNRIDQLEKMLPLQTQYVKVPFEYDLPGGEIFDTGTKHLRPTATGYYGLHFVSKSDVSAEVFITGTNFHPTQTHIIMAGKESHLPSDNYEVEVLSRQLLKVKIAQISPNMTKNPAELRVATPAGVSNGIEISFKEESVTPKGFAFNNFVPLDFSYSLESVKDEDGKPKSRFKYDVAKPGEVKYALAIQAGGEIIEAGSTIKVSFDFGREGNPFKNALKEELTAKLLPDNKTIGIEKGEATKLAKAILMDVFGKANITEGDIIGNYPSSYLSFSSTSAVVKITVNGKERQAKCEKLDVFLRRTAP